MSCFKYIATSFSDFECQILTHLIGILYDRLPSTTIPGTI